ncbi:MAG TPA: M23 family metallopeptidase [Candidatus Binatia bacterium]
MKAAAIFSFFLWLAAAPGRAAEITVSIRPAEPYQGGVAEIKILGGGEVKAESGGAELPVYRAGGDADPAHIALLGIDLEQRPGPVDIALRGRGAGGATWTKHAAVTVKAREFPREEITVPESFDQLDKATLKRIEKEQAALARLWKIRTPGRLWDGAFVAPVPGAVNSAFGFRRVVNGAARAPHAGTDLKAALGAEVVAANHGRVVLRDDFFFSGLSLVLDHGGGLYTMYFHFSEFRAESGAEVRKGQVIGLAGMTGRVTGPHLHWGARLNGARVDPLELLKIESQK